MTRSELMEALTLRLKQFEARDVYAGTREVIEALEDALVRGDRIEIRGFGSFSVYERPARQGRNPRTGEQLGIPARWVVHFKTGKELRERLNSTPRAGMRGPADPG